MPKVKGQLSIEFMVVFTGMLLIVASVTYPLYNQAKGEAEKLTALADAREAAIALANALNLVYAGGPGSRQTVEYWLPKGVVGFSVNPFVDGLEAQDGSISRNGRVDVKILFDFDGDGVWDNTLDSTVVVETLLVSAW
ncbi:MAG: hypothetical protein ACK4GQ_05675, partial [Candidatus Hadarchaeales archaeon]